MLPGSIELRQIGGAKLIDHIRSYYMKEAAIPPPLISERTAFVCAGLFTFFYVAPFYLSSTLRTSAVTSRDAPAVIRARVRAVGLTCLACTVVAVYLLAIYGNAPPFEVLRLLGIWPIDLLDIFRVLGLVMILFSCSLYETIIVDGEWRDWSPSALKEGVWDNWMGYRNLIVAPASEELVFRALTVPLFLLAKTGATRIVFITPLVFGLAHLHHLFAFLQSRTPTHQRFPPLGVWINGIFLSAFQFAYTSLFGFFAAFVFLRTGNLWAVIVAHSFCNKMGVPRLWGKVGQYEPLHMPLSSSEQDAAREKRDDDVYSPSETVKVGNGVMRDVDEDYESKAAVLGPKNLGVGWSAVYYALMFAGAYGFYKLLFPLTESDSAVATF